MWRGEIRGEGEEGGWYEEREGGKVDRKIGGRGRCRGIDRQITSLMCVIKCDVMSRVCVCVSVHLYIQYICIESGVTQLCHMTQRIRHSQVASR